MPKLSHFPCVSSVSEPWIANAKLGTDAEAEPDANSPPLQIHPFNPTMFIRL